MTYYDAEEGERVASRLAEIFIEAASTARLCFTSATIDVLTSVSDTIQNHIADFHEIVQAKETST